MSWIPFVAQAKSVVQLASGDSEGAKKTQKEFFERCPGLSQANAALRLAAGDEKGAARVFREGRDVVDGVVSGVPVAGHALAAGKYVAGHTESAKQSAMAATRSTAVMGAGAAAVVAAPVTATAATLGGVAVGAGVAMGAAYDGAHSAATGENQGHWRALELATSKTVRVPIRCLGDSLSPEGEMTAWMLRAVLRAGVVQEPCPVGSAALKEEDCLLPGYCLLEEDREEWARLAAMLPPDPAHPLARGTRVRLGGLTRLDLNGQIGTIGAFHAKSQRYDVDMYRAFHAVSVKVDNLAAVRAPVDPGAPRDVVLRFCRPRDAGAAFDLVIGVVGDGLAGRAGGNAARVARTAPADTAQPKPAPDAPKPAAQPSAAPDARPIWDPKANRWRDPNSGQFTKAPGAQPAAQPGAQPGAQPAAQPGAQPAAQRGPVWDPEANRWRDPDSGQFAKAPRAEPAAQAAAPPAPGEAAQPAAPRGAQPEKYHRGAEKGKRAYIEKHKARPEQDCAHSYPHEIHKAAFGDDIQGAHECRDQFVDHPANFRMVDYQINRSWHTMLDHDITYAAKHGKMHPHHLSPATVVSRINTQLRALQSSGGLGKPEIHQFYVRACKVYGLDPPAMAA